MKDMLMIFSRSLR